MLFPIVLQLRLLLIAAYRTSILVAQYISIEIAVQGGPADVSSGGHSLDSAHSSFPHLGRRPTGSSGNSVPTPAYSPFQALQVLRSASPCSCSDSCILPSSGSCNKAYFGCGQLCCVLCCKHAALRSKCNLSDSRCLCCCRTCSASLLPSQGQTL